MQVSTVLLYARIAVACLLLGGPVLALAQAAEKIAAAQAAATQQQLWQHAEWLNLVHYKPRGQQLVSDVDDTRFFNAPDGKTNPQAELLATIAALYGPAADDDEHPACRFIGRAEWFKHMLGDTLPALPTPQCALYTQWRAGIPDQQLTLVFPAYHLNSPSSMFGHTLLRLDPANLAAKSDWLSVAVNFGADVRAEDNSLFYAVKGLAGGYPGFFIVAPYFEKIREYTADENRDIWEYRLNLRPSEIRTLVSHLWELKTIRFDYYFFDENCSYRLLELLEVARPGIDLTSEFGLTAIPVDTVRAIERAGLIDAVAYKPSQITTLEQLLARIPASQHALVKALADNPEQSASDEFQALASDTQRKLVDAAYRYLRHDQGRGPRDAMVARKSYRLLEQLNAYPPTTTPSLIVDSIDRPENGHGSRRLMLGAGRWNQAGFIDLGWRMSFHGLEDHAAGFLQGAQINLGNFELRTRDDQSVRLKRLDLVDIVSLTPRSALFSPWSWRIRTGLEREQTHQRDVLVGHVSGGGGIAHSWFRNNQSYLMATLRLEHNREFTRTVEPAAGAQMGMLHHFRSGTSHLQLSAESFANHQTRARAEYAHNVVLGTQHAIRLSATRQVTEGRYLSEAGLAYLAYF